MGAVFHISKSQTTNETHTDFYVTLVKLKEIHNKYLLTSPFELALFYLRFTVLINAFFFTPALKRPLFCAHFVVTNGRLLLFVCRE